MSRRKALSIASLALLASLAAGCAATGRTATPPAGSAPAMSQAAATATAPAAAAATTAPGPRSTTTATGGPIRVQTQTPVPSATATVSPTPEPPCKNDLTYVRDESVPDGSQFLPGQPIGVKKWTVRNAGTCDWNAEYRLVLVNGNALGPRSEAALFPARAGTEALIEIAMTAPAEPGPYTGRWQARDPAGRLFGNVIFIKIEVIGPPTEPPPPPEGG